MRRRVTSADREAARQRYESAVKGQRIKSLIRLQETTTALLRAELRGRRRAAKTKAIS